MNIFPRILRIGRISPEPTRTCPFTFGSIMARRLCEMGRLICSRDVKAGPTVCAVPSAGCSADGTTLPDRGATRAAGVTRAERV